MDWQTLLNQLNAEYRALNEENPTVHVYDATNGNEYRIVEIYNEDGLLCIDIIREGS